MRSILILLAVLAASGAARAGQSAETSYPAGYPEGALWVGTALYYAEMGADHVTVIKSGVPRAFWSRPGCGPTAIAPYRKGFLILCHQERSVVAVSAKGETTLVIDRDRKGRRLSNPNDAVADDKGGVWFSDSGAFRLGAKAKGKIMHLSAGGELRRMAKGLHYANGIWFDADHRHLYASEHLGRRVLRFDVTDKDTLKNRAVFADIAALAPPPRHGYALAGPDGLEIDTEGRLFVPEYGEGRILVLTPDGTLDSVIDVETPFVTSVAFGPDGRMAITGTLDNQRAGLPGLVMVRGAPR